jgi:hypothetical protein
MAAHDGAIANRLRLASRRAGAVVFAVAGSAGPALASAAEKGRLGELADLVAPVLERGVELFWLGLDRQPSLMLAGAVASAVPLVAASAALLRTIARRARHRAALREIDGKTPTTSGRGPNLAWLQVENRGTPPLRLGELARIGCSEDCDLALGHSGVAEIHALIQRTPDCEFIIFDVSDDRDAGLAVNGTPSRRCRLRDGDRIEIGSACVVFHAKWTSQAAGQPMPA